MNKTHKTHRAGRRAAALAVALAATFAFAACSPASGNSAQQNDPSDPNTPSEPSDPSAPTASHSALLYDVLTNSYYRNLVEEHQEDKVIRNLQRYDPIPYGFLEDRGHDITGIKNDTLQADSVAYTKEGEPNYLYIATRAETAADRPYYTCYTLRYTLSDLEMSDVSYLHRNRAIESIFFIQELSYQKTPTVLSEAKIIVDAYNFMLEFLLRINDITSNLFGNENIALDFVSFSKENNSVVINLRDDHSNSFISEAEIRTANLVPSLGATIKTMGDNIYVAPHMVSFGTDEERQNYINNVTTVTYYDSQNIYQFNYGLYDILILNQ